MHCRRSADSGMIPTILQGRCQWPMSGRCVVTPMFRDDEVIGRSPVLGRANRRVHAAPDRARPDLRRSGGDRDRERAPVRRGAGADRRPEEALQQQTATADVLKVISRSAFDLQTRARYADRVGRRSSAAPWRDSLHLRDDDVFEFMAQYGRARRRRWPSCLEGRRSRPAARLPSATIRTARVMHYATVVR